jgi:hypothetical protein
VCQTTPPRSPRGLRRPGALDGLVHRRELLVPAELADASVRSRRVALEDHEVADEVEQVRGRQHAFEEHVLGRGLPPEQDSRVAASVSGHGVFHSA